MFLAASQSEVNYPVRSGGTIIDIDDYLSDFEPEFIAAYKTKIAEYSVPIPDRLYCNNKTEITNSDSTVSSDICGTFLGKKPTTEDGEITSILCSGCSTQVCTQCAYNIAGKEEDHKCGAPVPDAFDGQVLGVDYQICPEETCQTKVHLWAACNHMTCALCQTSFCYCCGVEAAKYSDHWTQPNPCPRYGKVGDVRAVFDGVHGAVVFDGIYDHRDADERREEIHYAREAGRLLGWNAFEEFAELQPVLQDRPRTDVEREEELIALWHAIRESPEGILLQLYFRDKTQLEVAWERVARQEAPRPILTRLIEALENHIDVYIMRIRVIARQEGQEDPEDDTNHQSIQQLAAQVRANGDFGIEYADVARILETASQAWNGNLDFATQRWSDIQEMQTLIDEHMDEVNDMAGELDDRFEGEPFNGDIRTVSEGVTDLAESVYLNPQTSIYYTHIRNHALIVPLFTTRTGNIAAHARIQELSAQVAQGAFSEEFADVLKIVEAYDRAWEGDLEFIFQRWQDLEEMRELARAHREILAELRPRAEALSENEITDGLFGRTIFGLISGLESDIEILYRAALRPLHFHLEDSEPWAARHNSILSEGALMSRAAWEQFQPLRIVYDTWLNAWNGVVDDRGRIVRPDAHVLQEVVEE